MGRAIDSHAERRGHQRVAVLGSGWTQESAGGLDSSRLGGAELAFEFTVPEAAERNLTALLGLGVSVVCGTTGWQPTAVLGQVLEASPAALIIESNFSAGMRLFFRVVEHAATLFGAAGLHEPYIHEVHHRGKRDVPSGTARRLAELMKRADPRIQSIQEDNLAGALGPGILQVSSTRAGSEPGRHCVGFDGEHDVITLQHEARGREGFALGAVLAAEWLLGRRGQHTLDEWLDELLAQGRGVRG